MAQQQLFYDGTALSNSQRILYTASSFAKTSLFYLQETGQLHAMHPHSSHRSGLASYLFFVIQSGSGALTYDRKTFELSAGDCVFIDCRKAYTHTTTDDLWQLKWCHFNGPSMARIYEKYQQRGGQHCFRPDNPDNFISILNALYRVAESTDHIRDMKINECLSALLSALMQESWQPETQQAASRRQDLTPVRNYLDEHFTEKITLDELSDRFFINKFYLVRLFKEQYGQSINHYLQQIRITKAKQLLRFTDKTVEQIGLECGLGAHSYFTRTFKKVEGITPSEFRSQWLL